MAGKFSILCCFGALAMAACGGGSPDPMASRSMAVNQLDNRYIVKFKPGKAALGRKGLKAAGATTVLELAKHDAVAVKIPPQALNGLQNNPNFEYIELDAQRQMLGSGAGQGVPYGIGMVQADQLSDAQAGNRMICIIDSGYDRSHEDLSSASNVTGTNDPGTGNWFEDKSGHGTHVAGTISALDNAVGVVGVLPGGTIRLHIVKVFGDDGTWAYSSSLVQAADTCAAAGANIISMSLGGSAKSRTEQKAFDKLFDSGILPIAAAGNDGNNRNSYPASYSSVISVAAVDDTSAVASFSQYNSQVELAAPGVAVESSVPMGTGIAFTLTVGGADVAAESMEGSPADAATGTLVDCGLGDSACAGASGAICLIQRGNISFADKVLACQAGGGIGAVIYNNEPGMLHGTLGDVVTTIPSVGISDTDGAALMAKLGQATTLSGQTINYGAWDGTSMATPHVSAVAALVWSYNPSWTNQQIRDALAASAVDLGDAGRDNYYGYGLVQAKAALDHLGGGNPGANVVPSASFTYSCTDKTCSFDASGSADADGSIVSYSWDLGDGGTASGITASHTFPGYGTHTVTLTVTDDAGDPATTSQQITLADPNAGPLSISNVSSSSYKGRNFTISWTTDQPATSVIEFTCCGVFPDSTLVTAHAISFEGTKNASYEYYVTSVAADGTTVKAGPFVHQN